MALLLGGAGPYSPVPGDYVAGTGGFIVGQSAVAVINPGVTLADGVKLRNEISRITKLPVKYIIFLSNDDMAGAAAFTPQHPATIGHWRLARTTPLTLEIHNTLNLDLGHHRLTLQAWPAAQSAENLTILDQQSACLWAGDLISTSTLPALKGNLQGWLATLSRLTALPAKTAIPGHGAPGPWPALARKTQHYLVQFLHDMRAQVPGPQVALGEARNWPDFARQNHRNIIAYENEIATMSSPP